MFRAPLALLVVILAASCQDFPPIQLCGQIPAGACPVGRGGTCDDPACNALYDCVGGRWTHTTTCRAPDGGTDGGGGAPDGGTCTPVSIDTSAQATGCTPGLENPDCPVEAALGCAEKVCLTGCTDFFMCTKAGWTAVAYCTDQGQIVVMK